MATAGKRSRELNRNIGIPGSCGKSFLKIFYVVEINQEIIFVLLKIKYTEVIGF